MTFSLLINMKMPTLVSYLLTEKISCSAELSMKKFYNFRSRFCLAVIKHLLILLHWVNYSSGSWNLFWPEVIKHFSCSTQLSKKFVLLVNLKLQTIAIFFLLNIAQHEFFLLINMKMPTIVTIVFHFHIY